MLYPSIQEILNVTSKDGEEKLNKYSVTMATAKCARIITNEYIKQRLEAEKKAKDKDEKDVYANVKKEYRDEKAVKNALCELKNSEFEVYLPGEEGYEDSEVEIKNYEKPVEESKAEIIEINFNTKKEDDEDGDEDLDGENYDDENYDDESYDENDEDFDSSELMGAEEIFNDDAGFSIEDGEDN